MGAFEGNLPFFPFGSRRLATGSTGSDVKVLQSLIDRACIFGIVPTDGMYGAETAAAVSQLQAHYSLPVTGAVDDDTFFVLGQGVGRHTPYGGPAFGSRTLARGATGGDVVVLQNRLANHRIVAQNLDGPADGIFGPATQQALTIFQALAGGQLGFSGMQDGVAGPETLDALWVLTSWGGRNLVSCNRIGGNPDNRPDWGTQGIDMLWLTFILDPNVNFLIRFSDTTPCRSASGDLFSGPVMSIQRRFGLAPDGIAGPRTFFAVGRNLSLQLPPVLLGPVAGAPRPCGG